MVTTLEVRPLEGLDSFILFVALLLVNRIDPVIERTDRKDFETFVVFWFIPFSSYIFWVVAHIGHCLYGRKRHKSLVSTLWYYFISTSSFTLVCCGPERPTAGDKTIISLKLRRIIMTVYYTASYFMGYGYSKKHALIMILSEVLILFGDSIIICLPQLRRRRKYRGKNMRQIVTGRIYEHFGDPKGTNSDDDEDDWTESHETIRLLSADVELSARLTA